MLGYERILVVWMWRRSGRQWFSPRGCVRGYDVDTVYFLKSFYTYIKLGNNERDLAVWMGWCFSGRQWFHHGVCAGV